jgi:hypothetical protein
MCLYIVTNNRFLFFFFFQVPTTKLGHTAHHQHQIVKKVVVLTVLVRTHAVKLMTGVVEVVIGGAVTMQL